MEPTDSSGSRHSLKELAHLSKGNFFGEVAMLKSGQGACRMANVKSIAFSIIYSMSYHELVPVMERFPSLKEAIAKVTIRTDPDFRCSDQAWLVRVDP